MRLFCDLTSCVRLHCARSLVAQGRHVLCVGETGTGKTLNVANKLMNDMPPEVVPVFMTFSARTSANQTQVRAPLSLQRLRSLRQPASSLPVKSCFGQCMCWLHGSALGSEACHRYHRNWTCLPGCA